MLQSSRFYRNLNSTERWQTCRVKKDTSDLLIRSTVECEERAEEVLINLRKIILKHADRYPAFVTSFTPLPIPDNAHPVLDEMYRAAHAVGVGPLAAVAGAIAEGVGHELSRPGEELIIENGGDIWSTFTAPAAVKIFPGNIYFTGGINIIRRPENSPSAVCTSSGKIGHSFSFGKAEAVTVIAHNGALADALATSACNMVQDQGDMEEAAASVIERGGRGVLIILRDRIVIQGEVELMDIERGTR